MDAGNNAAPNGMKQEFQWTLALIRRREDAMAGQAPALSPEEREKRILSRIILLVIVSIREKDREGVIFARTIFAVRV